MPGFEITSWYGVWVPRRTPKDIVTELNWEFQAMFQGPDLRQRFTRLGATPVECTPRNSTPSTAANSTSCRSGLGAKGPWTGSAALNCCGGRDFPWGQSTAAVRPPRYSARISSSRQSPRGRAGQDQPPGIENIAAIRDGQPHPGVLLEVCIDVAYGLETPLLAENNPATHLRDAFGYGHLRLMVVGVQDELGRVL